MLRRDDCISASSFVAFYNRSTIVTLMKLVHRVLHLLVGRHHGIFLRSNRTEIGCACLRFPVLFSTLIDGLVGRSGRLLLLLCDFKDRVLMSLFTRWGGVIMD